MKIALQTALASILGLGFFAIILFIPAGTLGYWQAWVFIAVFTACTAIPNLILVRQSPEVLSRRLHAGPTAETRPVQRIVTSALFVSVVAVFVVSALDYRFGWSAVPTAVVVLGNTLVAVGLLISEAVVFQNSYASANITVAEGQPLVSTGLYGMVRHPMYLGAVIMMVGTPLALGSYWALLTVIPAVASLVARILDEERMLVAELTGYPEYTQQVQFRVVPHVW